MERAAFEKLVSRNLDRLRQYVAGNWAAASDLNERYDVDDILSITLAEAWLGIQRFQGGEPEFYSWLRKIADNNMRDVARECRAKKRDVHRTVRQDVLNQGSSLAELLNLMIADTATPRTKLHAQDLESRLIEELERLNSRQQQAIKLNFFEGKSYQEICEIMGISNGALRNILRGAIKKLRSRMRHFSP